MGCAQSSVDLSNKRVADEASELASELKNVGADLVKWGSQTEVRGGFILLEVGSLASRLDAQSEALRITTKGPVTILVTSNAKRLCIAGAGQPSDLRVLRTLEVTEEGNDEVETERSERGETETTVASVAGGSETHGLAEASTTALDGGRLTRATRKLSVALHGLNGLNGPNDPEGMSTAGTPQNSDRRRVEQEGSVRGLQSLAHFAAAA